MNTMVSFINTFKEMFKLGVYVLGMWFLLWAFGLTFPNSTSAEDASPRARRVRLMRARQVQRGRSAGQDNVSADRE
ncbi:hypothetical protein B0J12DRAFT_642293 [Macrophomina phaseolina]|uniref:Uncharacterized protein n=1 Tax=Macrophomina phaseolina TaxID=35725 RepID=A0ABQ8GS21_9PEZI|nr:hypothetical protein B0J12DRAFT_642293 [Macrophomina phaseolina]